MLRLYYSCIALMRTLPRLEKRKRETQKHKKSKKEDESWRGARTPMHVLRSTPENYASALARPPERMLGVYEFLHCGK